MSFTLLPPLEPPLGHEVHASKDANNEQSTPDANGNHVSQGNPQTTTSTSARAISASRAAERAVEGGANVDRRAEAPARPRPGAERDRRGLGAVALAVPRLDPEVVDGLFDEVRDRVGHLVAVYSALRPLAHRERLVR